MRRCWSTKRVWNWRLPGWLAGPSRTDSAPNSVIISGRFGLAACTWSSHGPSSALVVGGRTRSAL